MTRKRVQLIAWFMGMFVYFSDYFSPLFVGSTMRALSDRFKISREKLAYICDSTSAPVSILVPITGWAVLVAGLIVGMGPIEDAADAMAAFILSIPFNLYSILAVMMVGLIAAGILPDFGPMKKAEERALNEGKLTRDDAQPLMADELTGIEPYSGIQTSLFWNFVFPVLLVIGFAIGSVTLTGSARPMESFLLASVMAAIIMRIQGIPWQRLPTPPWPASRGLCRPLSFSPLLMPSTICLPL